MKFRTMTYVLTAVCLFAAIQLIAQKKNGFSIKEHPNEKKIDVLYNGSLMTSYLYQDSVMKPVLYPLNTLSGITLTRGYPLDPRKGERVDHPHHIGLWLNYESVNGLDFWNNSTSIPFERRSRYGTIHHQSVEKSSAGKDKATLEVRAIWTNKEKDPILAEGTTYTFSVKGTSFIIDRETTLSAMAPEVVFKDVKDGFLGVRVTRELELPSKDNVKYVDDKGNVSEVKAMNNEGVSGDYLSSEGLKGNDVWGTRGTWTKLFGQKEGKNVSITIVDHPDNPGYPSYWHARGYGLFAVNPLGQEAFSDGKEKLNLVLKENEFVTFRYRVIVHEGESLSPDQIASLGTFGK